MKPGVGVFQRSLHQLGRRPNIEFSIGGHGDAEIGFTRPDGTIEVFPLRAVQAIAFAQLINEQVAMWLEANTPCP